MSTPDFAYLLSFCLFLLAAYKLGFRQAKLALDEKILHISSTVEEATQSKEMALLTLNELKHQLSELENNHKINLHELDLRGKEITHHHHMVLENLIQDRESHHRELLSQELRLHKKRMQEELLEYVFVQLKDTLHDDKDAQAAFHKKSMEMLRSA